MRATELDAKGLELWNAATRLRIDHRRIEHASRDKENESHPSLHVGACLTRVFAFMLLEAAWHACTRALDSRQRDAFTCFQNTVRVMKVALKAGKVCVAQAELGLATKVLERAAVFAEDLEHPPGKEVSEDDVALAQSLVSGYYVLRTTLAWKQSRLDIAEHMFAKAEPGSRRLDPTSTEELADTVFEIGRGLWQERKYEVAVKWLERALDVLSSQEVQDLSMDAAALRLSILQTLFKALLAQKTDEMKRRALDYLNLMEQDYPDKLVVLLLRLDLMLTEENADGEQYYSIIVRMVRSTSLTPVNLKTILFHVHKLKASRADLACTVVDELLRQRLLAEADKEEWTEKVLVTRVWLVCDPAGPQEIDSLEELTELFEAVYRAMRQPVSVAATHSVQTLLWRRLEAVNSVNQFGQSARWAQLMLHPLFGNCGEINKSKIGRKRIMCALAMQDFDAARQLFYEMSDNGKASPLTRFLMFKLALRTGDDIFAAENLDVICKASTEDVNLLYACVLEAQTLGDKRHAALALQKVLQQYDLTVPKGVNLPALLRCMVRLQISEISEGEKPSDPAMEELCKVFEAAVVHARRGGQHRNEKVAAAFDANELSWFARSSYNLAIQHCSHISPGQTFRLVQACGSLLALLQVLTPNESSKELRLRSAHCSWLMTCAKVTNARAEDNVEASMQSYLAVLHLGAEYRTNVHLLLDNASTSERDRSDLLEKGFQMVKFELEAALTLRQWATVDELFEHCWAFDHVASVTHWQTLADLVLVIHAAMVEAKADPSHLTKILRVLQTIINKTDRTKPGDTTHLAQWLRCLFQVANGFDEAACMQCLEQAHLIAIKRHGTSHPYPTVELEWLATTAFNRAVDYYCASDDEKTRLWADKALMLAGDVNDGGSLRALLTGKYSGLSWEE